MVLSSSSSAVVCVCWLAWKSHTNSIACGHPRDANIRLQQSELGGVDSHEPRAVVGRGAKSSGELGAREIKTRRGRGLTGILKLSQSCRGKGCFMGCLGEITANHISGMRSDLPITAAHQFCPCPRIAFGTGSVNGRWDPVFSRKAGEKFLSHLLLFLNSISQSIAAYVESMYPPVSYDLNSNEHARVLRAF